MLLAMIFLGPALVPASASAQAISFVADLGGDPALDPVLDRPVDRPAPEVFAAVAGPGPQAMTDDDLAEARGGFMTAGGFTFGFGAVVRSYVNGQLALKTQLTWTPAGPVTQQTQHSVPGVQDLASAMQGLAAGGIDLSGLQNAGGVAVIDSDGATAILHNITTSQLQNLIINNADNRNIRQEMELNLFLPDLAAIQADSRMQNYGSQILRDIDWAGLRGTGF
ncbi:hypothetical protein D8I30_03365 [Brevundimonas naejangsanensis]|uniref:TonB-dependent receptor n=1 Tax=Brevundimonas naejangsanensis TaxID=588932 RepID=A0A494RFW2_9CAUL|nr:hypothetical protein [Brevundimonas naejangsanensis]AYG94329.1 hypothetical protein D8I30_03365 [Brevundimonas naejangsanensis]